MVAAGPWVKSFWEMLELPMEVSIRNPVTREVTEGIPMWIYWSLQEGTLGVDPKLQVTNDGAMPPVIHVDTDAPLYSDEDGRLITDQLGASTTSPTSILVACRAARHPSSSTSPRPTWRWTPTGRPHPNLWWVQNSQRCGYRHWRIARNVFQAPCRSSKKNPRGIGAFTPDSFPVFDSMRENCFVIADSNHGYKMIGVGELVAQTICGDKPGLLDPFRFSRYAEGDLHPVSNSPFP
ncbi:MAG: hypothetical protein CM15mP84_03270 [Cellvibrionales bacterium]|nr:MAG: hypothetical protein CM15mP84_03270 [Cellvibrionales bacterium]